MGRYKLWSKRYEKPKEGADVYEYDKLPDPFRKQVIHILVSTLGNYNALYALSHAYLSEPSANQRWKTLFLRFTREMGVFHLGKNPNANPFEQCVEYLQIAPSKETLDFINCAFEFINEDLRRDSEYMVHVPGQGYQLQFVNEAIEELNLRFQEHSLGYQFLNGQLVQKNNQYLHEEAVVPALTLLSNPQFHGAQEEFLKAHQHYREQRYKEAVAEASKAFESTMKSILDERKWPYEKDKDTATKLVGALLKNHLIPQMVQDQFNQLGGLLKGGIVTVRNKTSGHGQGTKPVVLPGYVAEYALHLAATNIVFLVHAYEEYKRDHK